MKITIEIMVGRKRCYSCVEEVGTDETLEEIIEIFEQAVHGLGFPCGALVELTEEEG